MINMTMKIIIIFFSHFECNEKSHE